MKINDRDRQILAEAGIDEQQIEKQLQNFKKGFPFARLAAAAAIGSGISRFSEDEINELAERFDEDKQYYELAKFVPASGAASRMFKSLFAFADGGDCDKDIKTFSENIHKFAFFDDLEEVIKSNGNNIDNLLKNNDIKTIINNLLKDGGLNYGNLPKGLLKFHKYDDGARLAMEEHLVEAALCGISDIHFTVSPEHAALFEKAARLLSPAYEKKFGIKFNITFSTQKKSTDTIAATIDNEPFRDNNGNLVFRPGGHGALIENLNDLKKEFVFIKNIDNVVPDKRKDDTIKFKKALCGLLFKLQQRTFEYMELLDAGSLTNAELDEIARFAKEELSIDIPDYFSTYSEIEKTDFLYERLNRPMRVCGMVKNEGEPGGGPYWVFDGDGVKSLQIVESSQVNHGDARQEEIFRKSTHFNPVDLVCATRDFKGNYFDLRQFVDPEAGFISKKSKDGRELKAMELPGLWNGAMADWITIFAEVPSTTFNPVKTVNDLLREAHQ